MKINGLTKNNVIQAESIPKENLSKQSFKEIVDSVLKSIEPSRQQKEKKFPIKNEDIRNLLDIQQSLSKTYLNVELVTRTIESLNGTLRRIQNAQ